MGGIGMKRRKTIEREKIEKQREKEKETIACDLYRSRYARDKTGMARWIEQVNGRHLRWYGGVLCLAMLIAPVQSHAQIKNDPYLNWVAPRTNETAWEWIVRDTYRAVPKCVRVVRSVVPATGGILFDAFARSDGKISYYGTDREGFVFAKCMAEEGHELEGGR